MQQKILRAPILLAGRPEMADILNRTLLTGNDMAPDCHLAKAGLGYERTIRAISAEMRKRFPRATLPVEDPREAAARQQTDFVAFAYLAKNLQFARRFDPLDQPLNFLGKQGTPVAAFGILEGKHGRDPEMPSLLRKQVSILDYASPNDFIIQLAVKPAADELLLAKLPPKNTLAATIEAVQQRASAKGPQFSTSGQSELQHDEFLAVPRIRLGVYRRYDELLKAIVNPDWAGASLCMAAQAIRFELDETGVRLESRAMGGGMGGAMAQAEPRQFVFDRPFLLCLKQAKSRRPYFAMWIENAEVLEPVGR